MKKKKKPLDPRDHLHYDWLKGINSDFQKVMIDCERKDPEFLTGYIESLGLPTSQSAFFVTFGSYYHSGQNTYVPSPDLIKTFQNTSLRNVQRDWLELPHETFYLSVPLLPWTMPSQKFGDVPIRGFYVTKREEGLEILVVSQVTEDMRGRFQRGHTRNPSIGTYIYIHLSWEEYYSGLEKKWGDLEDYLSERSSHVGTANSESNLSIVSNKDEDLINKIDCMKRGVFRIVINFCLYLQSKEAEIKESQFLEKLKHSLHCQLQMIPPRKSKAYSRLQNQIQQLPEARVTYLGDSLPIPKTRSKKKKSSSASTNSLEYEKKIPGHWKRQWYGSENPDSSAGPRRCEIIYVFGYSQGPEGVIRPGANVVVVEDR